MKTEKPKIVEMLAGKEDVGICLFDYNQKPVWNKRRGAFDADGGCSKGIIGDGDIPQFDNLEPGQLCKVAMLIWPVEVEDAQ